MSPILWSDGSAAIPMPEPDTSLDSDAAIAAAETRCVQAEDAWLHALKTESHQTVRERYAAMADARAELARLERERAPVSGGGLIQERPARRRPRRRNRRTRG